MSSSMRMSLLHSVSISNGNTISLFRKTPKSVPSKKYWCAIDARSTPMTRRIRIRGRLLNLKQPLILAHHQRRLWPAPLCSADNVENSSYETSAAHSSSADHEGSTGEHEKAHGKSVTSTKILTKLKRYGISGILSYGLLNTAYYLTTFLLVWFYVAPAPGKMGFMAAAERFLKIMAMVWAGSQVTKLIRAGGALALAPFVDKGLSWFTVKCKFESKGKAFLTIIGFCFGLAVVLFFVVTLLSA